MEDLKNKVPLKSIPVTSALLILLIWIEALPSKSSTLTSTASTALTPQTQGWVPDYSKRDTWQQPEKIMDAIGVGPGTVVADVGAGNGYFTFKLADRVGPQGKVYATDIDKRTVKVIEERIRSERLQNIVPILGTAEDPRLPPGQMDIVLMVHVFHIVIHNQKPQAFLENIRPSLKPEGILVLVQWDGPKMGYPDNYAYSQESVLKVIEKSNFELVRTETFLPRETIFILRTKVI